MGKRKIPRYPDHCDMTVIGEQRHSVMSTQMKTGCGIEIPENAILKQDLPFSAATCNECFKWLKNINPRLK